MLNYPLDTSPTNRVCIQWDRAFLRYHGRAQVLRVKYTSAQKLLMQVVVELRSDLCKLLPVARPSAVSWPSTTSKGGDRRWPRESLPRESTASFFGHFSSLFARQEAGKLPVYRKVLMHLAHDVCALGKTCIAADRTPSQATVRARSASRGSAPS